MIITELKANEVLIKQKTWRGDVTYEKKDKLKKRDNSEDKIFTLIAFIAVILTVIIYFMVEHWVIIIFSIMIFMLIFMIIRLFYNYKAFNHMELFKKNLEATQIKLDEHRLNKKNLETIDKNTFDLLLNKEEKLKDELQLISYNLLLELVLAKKSILNKQKQYIEELSTESFDEKSISILSRVLLEVDLKIGVLESTYNVKILENEYSRLKNISFRKAKNGLIKAYKISFNF